MQTCNICCEQCSKFITCPSCTFEACMECHKRFILSKLAEPICMGCSKNWSIEFVMEKFDTRWAKFDFLSHIARLLQEKEKMLLPMTQDEANEVRHAKEIREKVRNLPTNKKLERMYKDPIVLQEKIRERNQMKYRLQAEVTNKKNDVRSKKEKKEYVMRCRRNYCRGFVTGETFTCATCTTQHCRKCKVVANDKSHICSTDDIINAEEIEKSTRPCPNCYIPIFKAGGCDQMWCPQCHTTFSFNTGKVDKGPIHNPVFFEYLASRPSDMPALVIDNIACGETPSLQMFMARHTGTKSLWLLEMYRYKTHIQNVIIPECSSDRVRDNIDLRIKYLNNDISEKQWLSTLLYRQKKKLKLAAIEQLFNTIVLVINDMLRKVYIDMSQSHMTSTYAEYLQLLNYKDERLERICEIHGGGVPVTIE